MPIPPTAKAVSDVRLAKTALARVLDAMAIDEDGYWIAVAEATNPIPAALRWAQKRRPGRRYLWDYENDGIRIWRVA